MATVRVEACPFPSGVRSLTPGFELLCLLWLKVVGPTLPGEADPVPQGSGETEPMPPRSGESKPSPSGLGEPAPMFLRSGEAKSTP
jgi:hypothetical protein